MAMNWPTFFTRLGSAVVFAAVMMCGLLWKDWMFVVLVAAIQVLCLRDYFRVTDKIEGKEIESSIAALVYSYSIFLLSICAFILFYLKNERYDSSHMDDFGVRLTTALLFISLCIAVIGPVIILVGSVLSSKMLAVQALRAIGGIVYITLPTICLLLLRNASWSIPLILILCIWMNDTMAYIVGSFVGKTPFSKISPKKTWEGTIGGALLTVIGAAAAAHFIPHQSMPLYIALALCAAIAGTAGDLFESKLKRMAGVKDSGTLMPGHGGALDRFDSLLVATPFAFCVVYLLQALA